MVSPAHLATFAVTSLLLILTPGPDIIYVLTRGMAQGRRAGLAAAAGFSLGNFAHIFCAAAGISAIISSSAIAFAVIRYCGACYLAYLGLSLLKRGAALVPEGSAGALACRTVFRQSILANMMNPKVALFFLAFFPQFLDRSRGALVLQVVTLGITFVVLTMAVFGTVAVCSGAVGSWLQRRPSIGARVGQGAGLILILLALRLAWP